MKFAIIFAALSLIVQSAFAAVEPIEIEIPTRSTEAGKENLKADFYTEDSTSAKPVILIQTPYNKTRMKNTFNLPQSWTGRQLPVDFDKYHYVVMDWRGFYANKDAAINQYDRGLDGYDAVEWIAAQNWCDGKVATWGGSALGDAQFKTIKHNPPHLVCAVPFIKDYRTTYSDYFYGGVFRYEQVAALEKLGFTTMNAILKFSLYNDYWKIIEQNSDISAEINVPCLMWTGWYDHYPSEIIEDFHLARQNGPEDVRSRHRLIVGPWLHSSTGALKQGELEYPGALNVPLQACEQFFEYYIFGAKNGWPLTPSVRYFVAGENAWETTDDWRKIGDASDTLFLHPGGKLLEEPLPSDMFAPIPPDTIVCDPRDPSPSYGGSRFDPSDPDLPMGPLDIREAVESRDDCLVYETETLFEKLSIYGNVKVKLYFASDREDTDFSIRLCDVFPDGRSIILTQGIQRMRFRNSMENQELLTPGAIDSATVELSDIAYSFLPGHKLKIVLTSSNYPMFDVNLNNGGELYQPGDTLVATNLIHHDYYLPSSVIFRVKSVNSVAEESAAESTLKIYPNPAEDYIVVTTESAPPESDVKIYDALGRLVLAKRAESANSGAKIELGDLPSGIYYLRVGFETGAFAKK